MQWMRRLGLTAKTRRSALVFLITSIFLTALIGAGLGFLELKPGLPLPSIEAGDVRAETETVPIGMKVSAFTGIFAVIFLGVFLLILIVQLVRGVPWKKVLPWLFSLFWKAAIGISALILVVALLPKSAGAPREAQSLPAPKQPVFAPLGSAPEILLWFSGIGILALIIVLGARMIAGRRRPPADGWETAAEQAIQALRDGEDLKKVILECYRRMSRALKEEQNIERESFMTVGEFEDLLAAKGVPHLPVHRLTALFEAARYGRAEPTQSEERDAIQSLEEILLYSRSRRTG